MSDSDRGFHPHLSNDHLLALGVVIANWATIEHVMGIATVALIMNEPAPEPITDNYMVTLFAVHGTDAKTSLDRLRALTLLRLPSDKDEFDAIADKIASAASERNMMAHAIWAADKNPQKVSHHAARTIGKFKRLGRRPNYSADDFIEFAAELEALKIEFATFFEKRGLLVRSQPEG
tara:strand:- start:765 stop:1295 length:531 start_codon:yes stop_codon:yes gene_type:complete